MKRLAMIAAIAVACSVSSEPKSFDAPSSEHFMRVSAMLQSQCGSLDCHGQTSRNFRLYSENGLRLSKDDIPGGKHGSPAENDANYTSVLALEPEILHQVFHDGGADPERLTLVRKGRNSEAHKGGRAFTDLGDRCLVSWLQSNVDEKTCFEASVLDKPPGFSGGGTGGTGGIGGMGGSAGSATGGAAGSVTGGNGGTINGGTGGVVTGGGGGTGGGTGGDGGGGGVVCFPGDFWPCSYDETCEAPTPSPADHDAYAADDCMACHAAGGSAGPGHEFLLAGVVWIFGAGKGADHIEVGLRDATTFTYTCTDARGFFSVPLAGSPVPSWHTVESRIRSPFGEKIMPQEKEHAPTCNSKKCHADVEHQIWAP